MLGSMTNILFFFEVQAVVFDLRLNEMCDLVDRRLKISCLFIGVVEVKLVVLFCSRFPVFMFLSSTHLYFVKVLLEYIF